MGRGVTDQFLVNISKLDSTLTLTLLIDLTKLTIRWFKGYDWSKRKERDSGFAFFPNRSKLELLSPNGDLYQSIETVSATCWTRKSCCCFLLLQFKVSLTGNESVGLQCHLYTWRPSWYSCSRDLILNFLDLYSLLWSFEYDRWISCCQTHLFMHLHQSIETASAAC
jgi:hypothetical protein